MFEKRVTPGKTYCVTAYTECIITTELNNKEIKLIEATKPGQYFFVAPTTSIVSSISPNYIIEMYKSGASVDVGSGTNSGVGISFEKVDNFDSLPATGQLGTIYLVPNDDTENQYTEYVYIDDRYEIIGSKEITLPDLSGYAVLNGGNEFSGNQNITGNVQVTGSLAANEDVTASGAINASNINASETINTVDQNISGTLTVSGDLITDGTGKDFQDIIDEHVSDDTRHVTAEAIQAVMPVVWGTGTTVIRSTAEDGTYTQLYFSGANTPLANTYHDGAPMLGYVTKDNSGNIVAAGTRSLIDLLTDNSTFAPASVDENGE